MKTVILREGLGPAEQDFFGTMLCRPTLNTGRKLLEMPCEDVRATDTFFLEVRIRNNEGVVTELRIPNHLVLLVATTPDERPQVGFVGPSPVTTPIAPASSEEKRS